MSLPMNLKNLKAKDSPAVERLKAIRSLIDEVLEEVDNQVDLIPLDEAAKRLNVSKMHINRMEKQGMLKIHRLSPRKLYVSWMEVEQAIKGL